MKNFASSLGPVIVTREELANKTVGRVGVYNLAMTQKVIDVERSRKNFWNFEKHNLKENWKMKLRSIAFVFILMIAILACSSSSPTTAPIDQPGVGTIVAKTMQALTPEAATSQIVPTVAVPATEATTLTGTVVTFGNATLVNPIGLASNISGIQAPVVGEADGGPWGVGPAHIELTLDGYLLQDKFHKPKIYVYPAQEFATANAGAAQNIIRLQTVLLNPTGPLSNDALPNVPFFNAGQVFAAQTKVIQFHNGLGVRMVTEYAQYYATVNNNDLFYHFQGLTNDGKYYIIAILPITAPMLANVVDPNASIPPGGVPFPGYESPAPDLETYYNTITTTLNAAAPETFNPTINILDALISSIQLNPWGCMKDKILAVRPKATINTQQQLLNFKVSPWRPQVQSILARTLS
jgi:hypothetical protein